MKKIVLTMVALLSMTAAVAQETSTQPERKAPKQPTPAEMTDRMASKLNLTDEQKAKVLALNTEYQDVLKGPGMRGGQPRPPKGDAKRPEPTDEQKAEMKAQMQKREEYDKKLKDILTDDQYKAYQKMQPRHHGGRGGHRGGHGRPQQKPEE